MTKDPRIISCENLDEALEHYTKEFGYRLDMIFPADEPREALLSKGGVSVRLKAEPLASASRANVSPDQMFAQPADAGDSAWKPGRAGMEYRDLIPDRMGGKVIASHIRLGPEGEVPDYVHYHKIQFQMIFCVSGRIKVVYEDQSGPFWIGAGDCVLQPPEIRHRVLECTAGAEVIEITMPAEHETWVEHDISLPTDGVISDREFNGQRFTVARSGSAKWELSGSGGYERMKTDIDSASGGFADVQIFRPTLPAAERQEIAVSPEPGKGLLICLEDGGSILIEFLGNG